MDSVNERNELVIQEIIKHDQGHLSDLYDSCIALDTLSAMGNEPLQKELGRIHAATSKKKLAKVAGALGSHVGPWLFTGVGVDPAIRNASMNVLYVGTGSLVLSSVKYYTEEDRFASVEEPFRKYISTLVTLAGIVNIETQEGDIDTTYVEDVVIDIEKKFAEITSIDEESDEDSDDENDGYYPMMYSDARAKYPLKFGAMTHSFHLLDKSAMTKHSKVLLSSPDFMERAEQLFNALELEDLKIYYAFLYVHSIASFLGDEFVQAKWEFFGKAISGAKVRRLREKVCADALITLLPDLIGKKYFLKMFDSDREKNVQLMVNTIKEAMGQHIAALTWLDDATREEAAAKLDKVVSLIGHSTTNVTYPFVLSRYNYLANVHTITKHHFKQARRRINKPVDRSAWSISGAKINAYYSPLTNNMVFPAAILQPPLYSSRSHPVQNFGAIGAVIGHELTHGFDSNGRHFDGDGNKREWWSESTAKEFEARATCMKNQYSQFMAYGDSGKPVGNVNGNLTIGENIADNGGVSLAFDAYHNWVKSGATFNSNGVKHSEVDQLFFVSYAQVWCGKIRDGALKQRLTSDVHSPKTARVNGVAMNSEPFSKTFQCKAGSKMNPTKKCQLW